MTPFQQARYNEEQTTISRIMKDFRITREEASKLQEEMLKDIVWINDVYQVAERRLGNGDEKYEMIHLSIKRLDRQPVHDWRDLQKIKNEIVGSECEGVELYPAESRRVDTANQYHLWVFSSPSIKFPFGFSTRSVSEEEIGNSKQRKFS